MLKPTLVTITTFVVMSRQVRLWYYAHATIPTDDAYSLFLQHIRGYTAVTCNAKKTRISMEIIMYNNNTIIGAYNG